jgi:hypothetical protein
MNSFNRIFSKISIGVGEKTALANGRTSTALPAGKTGDSPSISVAVLWHRADIRATGVVQKTR